MTVYKNYNVIAFKSCIQKFTVYNVCSEKKYSKRSSVLLLRLLYFFSERTLDKFDKKSLT